MIRQPGELTNLITNGSSKSCKEENRVGQVHSKAPPEKSSVIHGGEVWREFANLIKRKLVYYEVGGIGLLDGVPNEDREFSPN